MKERNNVKQNEYKLHDAKLDILVISTACFTAINRNIYKLFRNNGVSIEIVVPKTLKFGSVTKEAEIPSHDDPPIVYLNLKGQNPRINRFENLKEILNNKKPRVVLLDNEPVSLMANTIGRWCKLNQAFFYCLTYENFSLKIRETLKRIGYRSLPLAIIKRALLLMSRNYVDGVFTVNNEGTEIYKSESFNNVVRLPLGFDPDIFKIDNNARENIRNRHNINVPVIAFFGRVCHEKGVHILISALSQLMQYNWVLMIDEFTIYKNKYNETIQQLLETTGIFDRVIFINPNHHEIAGYMNAADVVVMPSISTPRWVEQYGRVAPEAMACGKKVIASNSGALPMLLAGHGVLIKEGSIESLKIELERFLRVGDHYGTNKEIEISQYAHESLSINAQYNIMIEQFNQNNSPFI